MAGFTNLLLCVIDDDTAAVRYVARLAAATTAHLTIADVRRLGASPTTVLLNGSPIKALVRQVVRGGHDLLARSSWSDNARRRVRTWSAHSPGSAASSRRRVCIS